MERLDRATLVLFAATLAIGFAVWQLLSALGYTIATLLIDLWTQGEEVFVAEFSVGGAQIRYGQLLAAAITLLLTGLVAILLLRRLARPGTDGPSVT